MAGIPDDADYITVSVSITDHLTGRADVAKQKMPRSYLFSVGMTEQAEVTSQRRTKP